MCVCSKIYLLENFQQKNKAYLPGKLNQNGLKVKVLRLTSSVVSNLVGPNLQSDGQPPPQASGASGRRPSPTSHQTHGGGPASRVLTVFPSSWSKREINDFSGASGHPQDNEVHQTEPVLLNLKTLSSRRFSCFESGFNAYLPLKREDTPTCPQDSRSVASEST